MIYKCCYASRGVLWAMLFDVSQRCRNICKIVTKNSSNWKIIFTFFLYMSRKIKNLEGSRKICIIYKYIFYQKKCLYSKKWFIVWSNYTLKLAICWLSIIKLPMLSFCRNNITDYIFLLYNNYLSVNKLLKIIISFPIIKRNTSVLYQTVTENFFYMWWLKVP